MAKIRSHEMIHPDFGQDLDPTRSGQTPPLDADNGGDDKPKTVTVTQEQWDQIQSDIKAGREEQSRLLATVLQGRAAPVVANQEPDVSLDLEGLPDPAEDRDGFLKGLTGRLSDTLKTATTVITRRVTNNVAAPLQQQSNLDKAWVDLKDRYEDLGEHEDVVGIAANKIVAGLSQRGINANAYLVQNPKQFVDDVAAEAHKTIDRIRGHDSRDTGADSNDDDGRSSVHGGGAGGTSRGGRKGKDIPALFSDEIKAVQKKMGFF